MTTTPPTAEVITDQDPGAAPIPWAEARSRLAAARFTWLATTHPSGRAQQRPILTVWIGDRLFSTTNPGARKGRNLAADGRCSVSASTDGMDLVLEGSATFVDDEALLAEVAEAYDRKYGWPVTVADGAFDAPYGAPTAGPPPYRAYEVAPDVAFAFGTDDTWAPRTTRFTF